MSPPSDTRGNRPATAGVNCRSIRSRLPASNAAIVRRGAQAGTADSPVLGPGRYTIPASCTSLVAAMNSVCVNARFAPGEPRVIQEGGHVPTTEVVRTHHAVRLGRQPPSRRQPLVGVGGAVRLGIGDAQRALRFVGRLGSHRGVLFASSGIGRHQTTGWQDSHRRRPGANRRVTPPEPPPSLGPEPRMALDPQHDVPIGAHHRAAGHGEEGIRPGFRPSPTGRDPPHRGRE